VHTTEKTIDRIQFNTGRPYTAAGQQIVAIQEPHGILFKDFSRGIWGIITEPCELTQAAVMRAYDQYKYDYDYAAQAIRWID